MKDAYELINHTLVSLINAVKGNVENALLFCGAKAWKAQKIDTVREAVQELFA